MTFYDFALSFLAEKRGAVKPNTYKTTYDDMFRLHLLPRFGKMPLETVGVKDVSEFMRTMAEKYSDSVLCKLRICLRGMYATAIEEGLCTINPAANIRVKSRIEKRVKRTYSPSEADALFAYAATHRYGLGVCIMLDMGLRCSEMLGLRWDDVDFRNGWLYVRRASVAVDHRPYVSTPKSDSSNRVIPISNRLLNLLYAQQNTNQFIVSSPSGGAYTPANYTKNRYNVFFADCQAAIGLHRLSPHELRHTCGTNLYASSGDIYAVSKYLGHSDISITSRLYVHSSPEILRRRLKM